MITSTAHIYGDTPVQAALRKEQEAGAGRYISLNIGSAGQMTLFVNSREKALELASLLERTAQEWEGEV